MITPFVLAFLLTAASDRPDLSGRVLTDKGEPVAGAHVSIDSAAVRRGTSPLCPSCYLDCRKRAETDRDGRFTIAAVDPELLFNVLVVAEGFRPTFARKSDPAKGPVTVKLEAFDPEKLDPRRVLRGVVLDPDGKPLAGARVSAQGFSTEAFSGFGPDIFDPVAVANLRGEFVLASKSPIEYADLKVQGNGVAPRIVPARRPGANPHRIRMTAGATITGRLVRDGGPLAGAAVGLVQASRSSDAFLGDVSIGTDERGRFTFLNVHPDESYFVYGLVGTLPDAGAVPARRIRVDGEGTTLDLGDLPVVVGHRLKGQVLLADGKPIPPGTRLLVSREDAWDSTRVELDREGRFAINGLPNERYSLSVSLKGYKLSRKNHSVDPQNGWSLVGTIDQDIEGLKVLMEPGRD